MQKASKTTESLFVGSYLTVEIEVNKVKYPLRGINICSRITGVRPKADKKTK